MAPSQKADPVDDEVISEEKAAYIGAILGFVFKVEPGFDWDEVTNWLASRLEQTASNRKNLQSVKAFFKFMDQQKPKPTIPRSGRAKAELLVKLIRK